MMGRRLEAPAQDWAEPSARQRAHAVTLATLIGALVAFVFLALCTSAANAQAAAPPHAAGGPSGAPSLSPSAAWERALPDPVRATPRELLSALRQLRHAPGQEVLGIAHVAAYLRAADAGRLDAEPFDTLGVMAERLAHRASQGQPGDTATAAQVQAVASLGVRFVTLQREGRPQLCYDGEAFRRVLALKPSSAEQARAILALTRHDCVDPQLQPAARVALDAWRADLLDLPWPRGYNDLPQLVKNRLHLRRAGLWAERAHQQARQGRPAQAAAERAIAELAAVDKSEFNEDDQREFADAAIRVGAARWAAAGQDAMARASAAGLRLVAAPGGEPGQTCVLLLAAEGTDRRGAQGPHRLAERCTFGTVWLRSMAVRPGGDAMVLAVQPREGWTELWLFRAGSAVAPVAAADAAADEGRQRATASAGPAVREHAPWRIDVLPPAAGAPGLGYIEFAGWVPGPQPRLLIARESRTEGRFHRRFEVLALDTLGSVKQADTPHLLVAFGQWSDAQWRQRTVALR